MDFVKQGEDGDTRLSTVAAEVEFCALSNGIYKQMILKSLDVINYYLKGVTSEVNEGGKLSTVNSSIVQDM